MIRSDAISRCPAFELARRPRARGRAAALLVAGAFAAAGWPAPGRAISLTDASPLHGPATLFHAYPLARVDNAFATVVNPGGLAARPSGELVVLATDSNGLRDGDVAILIKRLDFGIAYERYRPFLNSASVARVTIATSRALSRRVFFGSSYASYFSKDDSLADLSSVDLGLLARWPPHLSIAATATGVNRPGFGARRLNRRYALGVGYSPVRRLVLFAEDVLEGGTSLAQTAPAYGIEVEPSRGIILRGRADTDGNFRFGVEYNFVQNGFGVVGLYDPHGKSEGRAGYVRMSDETAKPEVPRQSPRGRGRR